jgi:hypothetical protein
VGRELSGPGVRRPNIYVLISGEIGISLKPRNKLWAKNEFGIKNVMLLKPVFTCVLLQEPHGLPGIRRNMATPCKAYLLTHQIF